MGYFDELTKGGAADEKVTGESFTYNGTAGFKGVFSDEDTEITFALTGKKTKRALTMDATKAQFAAKAITPVDGKVLIYEGKNYVVRKVFSIGGEMWRFKIYLP